MQYKVTLLKKPLKERVSLQQLAKNVIPRVFTKDGMKDISKLGDSTIVDENNKPLVFSSSFDLMVEIINKGLLPVELLTKIKNILISKGYKEYDDAVRYFLEKNPQLVEILDFFVYNKAPLDKINAVIKDVNSTGTFGSEGSRQKIHKKAIGGTPSPK